MREGVCSSRVISFYELALASDGCLACPHGMVQQTRENSHANGGCHVFLLPAIDASRVPPESRSTQKWNDTTLSNSGLPTLPWVAFHLKGWAAETLQATTEKAGDLSTLSANWYSLNRRYHWPRQSLSS